MAGDYFFGKISKRFSGTATGTNAGVTLTQAAGGAGKRHNCWGIECSGDAAAVVTVESPASTILFQKRFSAAFTMSESFPPGTIMGSDNGAMLVKISASTSACEANIQGVTIP